MNDIIKLMHESKKLGLINEYYKLKEMSMPLPQHKSKIWYHGTPKDSYGKKILKYGIQIPDLADRKGMFRPREGKVYITTDVRYAEMYCLGGDIFGMESEVRKFQNKSKDDRYGWLFSINGKNLIDIEPDEDSIGLMLYYLINNYESPYYEISDLNWLLPLARKNLTDNQYSKVKEGDLAYYAVAGKKLIPLMTDDQILSLISSKADVGHSGDLIPEHAWRFDKLNIGKLKKDGSNFFEYAEKIK